MPHGFDPPFLFPSTLLRRRRHQDPSPISHPPFPQFRGLIAPNLVDSRGACFGRLFGPVGVHALAAVLPPCACISAAEVGVCVSPSAVASQAR